MLTEEAKWMEGILPDHYTCEPKKNGVHCHSEIGIQDTFPEDSNGDDHWDIIMKAIKQKFGDRFMEVFAQVSTRHKQFTVYIKPAVESTLSVLDDVMKERLKQNEKWGIQDHHPVEWIAILTEEVGEAAKEAVDFNHGNVEDLEAALGRYETELIQTAAVAVQAVESLRRTRNKLLRKE